MTFDRLYYLVRRLSNFSWCRYWILYDDCSSFAIQCIGLHEGGFEAFYVPDLKKEDGFVRIDDNCIYVFTKEVQ